MTTPENATNVASYKWEAVDNATATEGTALGLTSSLVVTEDMAGKFIKLTVTDTEGNTFTAVSATTVTKDNTSTVVITNESGFQSDGTALAGDTLSVTYGSALGIPQGISWYADDVVIKTEDFQGTSGKFSLTTGKTGGVNLKVPEGAKNVYAIVVAKDGTQYKSTNTVVVTATELPVTVTDFEILNDYDKPELSYAAADARAVIKFTTSKKVTGDLYIYKDTVAKYGTENKTAKLDGTTDIAAATQVTAITSFTAKDALGATKGVYYVNEDGSVTYLISADTAATAFTLTRGTAYKAVYDQKNIDTDDIKATTREDATIVGSFTAPYLTTPAKAVLTKHKGGAAPELTLYNDKDEILTWMGTTTETTPNDLDHLQDYGVESFITYDEVGSAKAKKNKATQGIGDGNSSVKAGVFTGNTALGSAATYGYYWAQVKFGKGIFAAGAVELETEIVAGSEAPVQYMNIVDKEGAPKTAIITFSKLATNGTVYVVEGSNGKSTAADIAKTLDVDDPSTYTAKAEVAKGATKIEIENAIQSYVDSVAVDATDGCKYVAVFKPAADSDYDDFYPTTFANKEYKVDDAEASSNLELTQVPTSVAYDAEGTAETVTTKNIASYDKTATISDIVAGGKIVAKDQFGDTITGAVDAKTVNKIEAVNNTLTTTEDANAQYEIGGTGLVTINLYRSTAIDAGDGFDVTILGTVIKLRSTNGIASIPGSDTTGLIGVQIGSDTLIASTGAAALIVSDNAAVSAAVSSAGSFTMTGTTVTDAEGNLVKNASLAVTDFATGGMTGVTAVALSTNNSGVLVVTTTGDASADGAATMTVLGKTLTLTSSDTQAKLAVTSWE